MPDEQKVTQGVDGEVSSADTNPLSPLEQQLAEAQTKAQEHLDGWQRALADLQNARRRFDKERLETRQNATVDVALQLLPILDDFELAMNNVSADVAASEWYGGFQLIPRKLKGVIEKIGLERIESLGKPFDPQWHNAIMREASDQPTDTIIREFQPGYKVGDRVVRPAVVAVAE